MLVEQTGNRKWPCYLAKRWISLSRAGKDNNFELKTGQKSIIEAVVCQKKYVLGVLPTVRKSLSFYLRSDTLDFVDSKSSRVRTSAKICIVSL